MHTPFEPLGDLWLREHRYTHLGHCTVGPVYRTQCTDSMSQDRQTAPADAIVLTAHHCTQPSTAEHFWPAPSGNLYLSIPFWGRPTQAREALTDGLEQWWMQCAPDVPRTVRWDGWHGAHRAADNRFLSGLTIFQGPRTGVCFMGIDVHLSASEDQYKALHADHEHTSIATLTGRQLNVDEQLWSVLRCLTPQHESP